MQSSSLFFSITKNIILLLIKNAYISRNQRMSHVVEFRNGGIWCLTHFKKREFFAHYIFHLVEYICKTLPKDVGNKFFLHNWTFSIPLHPMYKLLGGQCCLGYFLCRFLSKWWLRRLAHNTKLWNRLRRNVQILILLS